MGFKVVIIDHFDYERFVRDRKEYLVELYGREIAEEQIKNSDMPSAIEEIQKLLSNEIPIESKPSLELLKTYLDQGYLMICNVNSATLNSQAGYFGHFVVVYHIDESHVHQHDTGLPPQQSRVVNHDLFMNAWESTMDGYGIRLNT